MIERLNSECDLLLNAWYLDDGTLVGPTDEVLKAFHIIQEVSPSLGLKLNLGKCELWWSQQDPNWNQFPSDIIRLPASGTELLGSAVGTPVFIDSILSKRVEKIGCLVDSLVVLENTQVKLHLLRSCVGFPKFSFALRTMHANDVSDSILAFDQLISSALSDILGVHIGGPQRLQMALPIGNGYGGFDLPLASAIAPAAYIASYMQSQGLQCQLLRRSTLPLSPKVLASLEVINRPLNQDEKMLPQVLTTWPNLNTLQQTLSFKVHDASLRKLYNAFGNNSRERSRLNSCRFSHSGDFLQLLPTYHLQQKFGNTELQMICRFHLGLSVFPGLSNCSFCGQRMDQLGIHASVCSRGGGPIRRHDRIRDYLAAEFRKAGFQVQVEPRDLCTYNARRPADVQVMSISPGQDLLIDVSIASPFTNAHVSETSVGQAAELREREKRNTYAQELEGIHGALFTPFVIESMGGRGPITDRLLRQIACSQAYLSGQSVAECQRSLNKGLTALFWHEMTSIWQRQTSYTNTP